VDITFRSPSIACMVTGWRVMGKETLSDHRYIRMDVFDPSFRGRPVRHPNSRVTAPRWAIKRLDGWRYRQVLGGGYNSSWADATTRAAWFRETMTQICDASISQSRTPSRRREVYLRKICNTARRQYTRCRHRRRHSEAEAARLYLQGAQKFSTVSHQEGESLGMAGAFGDSR